MIVFFWNGFAQYAARCVRAFVKTTDERVVVIATRPTVPIKGMEELCGCELKWIEPSVAPAELLTLIGDCPRVLFTPGWGVTAANLFRDEVRRRGGRVICMTDINVLPEFKELMRWVRFRLCLRHKYDGFLVAGKNGRRSLRLYGVPNRLIREGLFPADASLFTPGAPLSQRPKKILYVGRFIELKNVRRLCEAFCAANKRGDWSLELYGSGPLKEELAKTYCTQSSSTSAAVHIHDFVQPEQLAGLYREARVLCLPSLWDHWGLVVHEAALSGCALFVSKNVGAGMDFCGDRNSATFNPASLLEMTKAFERLFSFSDELWNAAGAQSVELGRNGPGVSRFVQSVQDLIDA